MLPPSPPRRRRTFGRVRQKTRFTQHEKFYNLDVPQQPSEEGEWTVYDKDWAAHEEEILRALK